MSDGLLSPRLFIKPIDNKHGFTTMHIAAYWGDLERVMLCLNHGDDISASSKRGFGPLGMALLGGHPDVALDLLKYTNTRSITLLALTPEEIKFLESMKDVGDWCKAAGKHVRF